MAGEVVQSEEMRGEIVQFLQEELSEVLDQAERGEYEERLRKWRRQREADPEHATKDWPWEGSANVSVPFAASKTQVGFASLKASITQRKPRWMVEAHEGIKGLHEHAQALTNLFRALEGKQFLNLARFDNMHLYSLASEGTHFTKIPWVRQERSFKRRDPINGQLQTVRRLAKAGPQLVSIRQEDAITRSYWDDVQEAPWFSHRFRIFTPQMMQRRAEGIWDAEAVDMIMGTPTRELDEGTMEQLEQQGISPRLSDFWELHEVHFMWDIDEDGIMEDLIFTFDRESGAVLREDLNDIGKRIITPSRYIQRPHNLLGLGIGKMMERLQDEGDTIHNLRLDAIVMNLLKMWVARRGSQLARDEEMHPGKVFIADDPTGDVAPMPMAPVDPQSIAMEQIVKSYGDVFTGFGDTASGMADQVLKSRDTFRGAAFRDQKGSEVFFQTIADDVAQAYSDMGETVFFQLARHRDQVNLSMLSDKEQKLAREVLAMNVDRLPETFQFKVEATELDKTDAAKQQSRLTVTQLYAQFAQQMFPIAQALGPQVMKDHMMSIFIGATALMRDTLQDFGINDAASFLPNTEQARMLKEALDRQIEGSVNAISLQTGAGADGRGALRPESVAAGTGNGAAAAGGAEPGEGAAAE